MKRMYKIPKIFSFSFKKLTFGLWKWNENFWWGRYAYHKCWHEFFTTWQAKCFKCTVYRKLEIQWLYHFYFQIIIDK